MSAYMSLYPVIIAATVPHERRSIAKTCRTLSLKIYTFHLASFDKIYPHMQTNADHGRAFNGRNTGM
jgi:hypothetical protein